MYIIILLNKSPNIIPSMKLFESKVSELKFMSMVVSLQDIQQPLQKEKILMT